MIPLSRPFFNQAELDEVKSVLESGWVAQGPKCREFEEKFAAYIGARYGVSTSSCTTALHLALLSLGIGNGDEVLVSDFTFPATANAVRYVGAEPVFVDIQQSTYNMEPSEIKRLITPKTKAIIVVHAFGNPADLDVILEVAKENDLKVVEDAACAHGATYRGKRIGTFGDISCFSFHARKILVTGEGGMLLSNDFELAEHARRLATHGIAPAWNRQESRSITPPQFLELGFNFRLSDIAAAIGLAQLDKVDEIIRQRQKLAAYYRRRLADLDVFHPQEVLPHAQSAYQSYVGLLSEHINRDQLVVALKDRKVQATFGTYACHFQPLYQSKQSCPKSLDVFNRSIALPFYHQLTYEQINSVVEELVACIKR